MLNSLDLNLNLREKLLLINIAMDENNEKCDVKKFIGAVENEVVLSDKAK
jgi:hypothetical protein